MPPKVSIVVSIYNVEKYLDRCMESLLNQTLKDIEIIMVDDESPDRCPQMCDEYARKDSRVKVIHKKNGGLGFARNSGMEIAQGKYIAFIDSDDYIEPNTMELLYNRCEEHHLDVCFCGYIFEYASGASRPKSEVAEETYFLGNQQAREFALDMIGPLPNYPHDVKFLVSVWKACYSMPTLIKFQATFDSEKVIASEDMLFHARYLPLFENIGVIPDCLYHYCQNGGSISRSYSEQKRERILLSMRELLKRLKENYSESEFLPHYQRCLFLSIRGLLNKEVNMAGNPFFKTLSNIKAICNNDAYQLLFKDYDYKAFDTKRRVYYWLMKNRCAPGIYLFNKLIKASQVSVKRPITGKARKSI